MPDWLASLLRDDARGALHEEGDGVLSVLPPDGAASAGRFEGLYGAVYDRTIRTGPLRRLAPLAYGDVGPLTDLDGWVAQVAASTRPAPGSEDPPVLLDVPSGGGTLLPLLRRAGYAGRVVECDLGAAMLARAAGRRDELSGDVALLRADAQDLPLADGSVDGVVSLNGLHCMPDPDGFVRELGRVLRAGAKAWLITLVSRGSLRGDAVIAAGRVAGIIPTAPPTRSGLDDALRAAGFSLLTPLGGDALTGVVATR